MHGDIDAFVALRMASLSATPGFLGGEGARAKLRARYADAGALGRVHEVVRVGRRPVAQLMFFSDPEAWFGGPVVPGWVDRDPADAAALAPLMAAVDAHAAALGAPTLLEIRTDDAPLREALAARGFGIDSVIQLGAARSALAALGDDAEADARLAQLGLAARPLAREQVGEVVELHRKVFASEPEWCWFGAYPHHLARMQRALERDRAGHFALVDAAARVVGHIGAELHDDPFWGRVGGLELVLADELRGRGLSRALYRVALTSLVARGAGNIKGGTAQPAVLALGRRMRRPWQAFNLRRGVAFAAEHFLAFAG